MSNYKDELVDIYVSCSLSEIKNSRKYHKLCEQYDKNSSFHAFREKIERIKKLIEEIVEKQSTEKGQVTESLIITYRVVEDKNEEILKYWHKLITKLYEKKWSPKRWAYFKDTRDKLTTTDYDYFLSFTRRKRSAGGYNPVNNNYEHFIKAILGRHRFNDKERVEKNLLARSIHHILKDSGYKGFFYPEHIGDNQLVDTKVEKACINSHIFIQLIQDVMFDKPESVENYCFKEYDYVKNTFSNERILFVLAEGDRKKFINRLPVCLSYRDWYNHVLNKDSVILRFTTTWKQKDIDAIKKEIEENIGNKIEEYKENLFKIVP
jgi:hypothetical protein